MYTVIHSYSFLATPSPTFFVLFQAVMKMRSSLQEDMKSIVEKEVAGLRWGV